MMPLTSICCWIETISNRVPCRWWNEMHPRRSFFFHPETFTTRISRKLSLSRVFTVRKKKKNTQMTPSFVGVAQLVDLVRCEVWSFPLWWWARVHMRLASHAKSHVWKCELFLYGDGQCLSFNLDNFHVWIWCQHLRTKAKNFYPDIRPGRHALDHG